MCLSNIPVSLVSSSEWSSQIAFQMDTELDPQSVLGALRSVGGWEGCAALVCSDGPWDLRAPVCMKQSKNGAV